LVWVGCLCEFDKIAEKIFSLFITVFA